MIAQLKTRRKAQSDPRYRNGVFVGHDPHEKVRQAIKRQSELAAANPATYGWQRVYWHSELDQQVWQLGQARMVYLDTREGWQVDINGDSYFYTGPMADITADVHKSLPIRQLTANEIRRRQAAWDAVHPDFDNGVA